MTLRRKGKAPDIRHIRKGQLFALTGLVLATTSALPSYALAANYIVFNQAQLIAAINAANADGDPSSTITLRKHGLVER